MKIILLKDINKLGKKHEIKDVADGFALNFLIPQKIAEVANQDNIRQLEINKQKSINKKQKAEQEINKLISKMKNKKLIIKKDASEKGKLFAAVSLDEILSVIKKDLEIDLDKNQVDFKEHIKELGEHKVKLKIRNKMVDLTICVNF